MIAAVTTTTPTRICNVLSSMILSFPTRTVPRLGSENAGFAAILAWSGIRMNSVARYSPCNSMIRSPASPFTN